MFQLLVGFLIFLIIFILYLHIVYHLKTSNEAAVYEMEFQSKEQLDNICQLRQPIVFLYPPLSLCERDNLIDKFGNVNILIKNVDTNELIPYRLNDAIELIDKDTTGSYYMEKNYDLIKSNMIDKIAKYEKNFRPTFTCKSKYDILIGSNGSHTSFQYEVNYRNYFIVTEGVANIRLAPPKCEEYLDPQIDYETLDITSSFNIWKNPKIKNVELIDVVLTKGQIIYIPPYWWYSIQFTEKTSILSLRYRTYMNLITLLPQILLQAMQLQNIHYIIGNDVSKPVKKNKKKNKNKNKKVKPIVEKTK
jgi:hypothetical protein